MKIGKPQHEHCVDSGVGGLGPRVKGFAANVCNNDGDGDGGGMQASPLGSVHPHNLTGL